MKTEMTFKDEATCIAGKTGHLQGIAIDKKRKHLYWSFTTMLIKTDLKGKIIGSVGGLIGHLGCIAYCDERDELWGSLELKRDTIGQGISNLLGRDVVCRDAFYAVVFNTEKITRENMSAEKDGVMAACCLLDVCEDYSSLGENNLPHRYGCSGIDGITFAPKISESENAPLRMFVAYGIYGDVNRTDNDDQILLSFDPETVKNSAFTLCQEDPHNKGIRCEEKIFIKTGNTNYGIQNLEYDSSTDSFFAAVYPGHKPQFSNPPMFVFSRKQTPYILKDNNVCLNGKINSFTFPLGSTGLASLGNGEFLVSESYKTDSCDAGIISRYKFTGISSEGFEKA